MAGSFYARTAAGQSRCNESGGKPWKKAEKRAIHFTREGELRARETWNECRRPCLALRATNLPSPLHEPVERPRLLPALLVLLDELLAPFRGHVAVERGY